MRPFITLLFILISISLFSQQNNFIRKNGYIPNSKDKLVEIFNSKNGEPTLKSGEVLPANINWADSIYFPPIGFQNNGSCVSWALTYYSLTFLHTHKNKIDLSEAEWDWDLKAPEQEYQKYIMSPYFTYNISNHGIDDGSSDWFTFEVLRKFGAATWDEIGDKSSEPAFWPNSEVWKSAAKNRIMDWDMVYRQTMEDEISVVEMKSLLNEGKLLSFSIRSEILDDLIVFEDIPNFENYADYESWTNHYVTIVGYDDSYSYIEEGVEKKGAFIVANSWGDNWGAFGNGTFYASYKIFKEKVKNIFYLNLRENYSPKLFVTFDVEHTKRNECQIEFKKYSYQNGSPTPIVENLDRFFIDEGYFNSEDVPFNNSVSMDVTEYLTQLNEPCNIVLEFYDLFTENTGTVKSFQIEYISYNNENVFRSEIENMQTVNNSKVTMPVVPLSFQVINSIGSINSLNNNTLSTISIWDEPVSLDVSLDLLNWQNIFQNKNISGSIPFLLSDCSSNESKLKLYFDGNPQIAVTKDFIITGTGTLSFNNLVPDSINSGELIELQFQNNLNKPIQLSLRNETEILDVIFDNQSQSSFNWNVPGIGYNDSCYFQITDMENNYAFSNRFVISSPLNVSLSNPKDFYLLGDTIRLDINMGATVSQYDLSLYKSSEKVADIVNGESTGHVSWIIPENLRWGNDYKIKINSTDNLYSSELSEKLEIFPFTKIFSTKLGLYPEFEAYYFWTPAILDSYIYITGQSFSKYDLSGKLIWETRGSCNGYHPVVITDNNKLLYNVNQLWSELPNFYCYNTDGNLEWDTHFSYDEDGGGIMGSNNVSAFNDKMLVLQSWSDKIKCYNSAGEFIWDYSLNNKIDEKYKTTPSIDAGNNIYTAHQNFYCIDSLGNEKWVKEKYVENGFSLYSGNTIIGIDQSVFITSEWGIVKISNNGEQIWKNTSVSSFFQPSIGYEGNIFISDSKNRKIVCLDSYGNIKWEKALESMPLSSPTLGESGMIYVATADQSIICLDDEGSVKWIKELGIPFPVNFDFLFEMKIGACTIGDNGDIYYPAYGGQLYIISFPGETGLAKTAWPKNNCDLRNSNHQKKMLKIFVQEDNSTPSSTNLKLAVQSNLQGFNKIVSYKEANSNSWIEIGHFIAKDTIIQFVNEISSSTEYRVQIEDLPGLVDYTDHIMNSQIVSSTKYNLGEDAIDCKIYPNPNNGNFILDFKSSLDSEAVVKIVNTVGQVIETRQIIPKADNFTEQFNLSGLDEGLYIIGVSSGTFATSKKLIIQ